MLGTIILFGLFGLMAAAALGAITIPDRTAIRLTTDNTPPNNGQQLPTVLASAAMVNPGPIRPHVTQNNPAGNCIGIPAVGAAGSNGCIGYNIKSNVAAGEPLQVHKGVVVDGFAGVTPGLPVYADATNSDAAADASGLSHTQIGTERRLGVGWTATRIRFD
jgi:hypothetical protein